MSVQQDNEKLSDKLEQQKQYVLDTIQRCLENSTNLRLTAKKTQILGQTDLLKDLFNEVDKLDNVLFDLNNQKKAVQEKIKYCVVNGIGLRLSSLELKLLCETEVGRTLSLNDLVEPKTELEYLKETVEKIQKAISLSYGIRLSTLELSFLAQTKTIEDFLKNKDLKKNLDSKYSSKTIETDITADVIDFPQQNSEKSSVAKLDASKTTPIKTKTQSFSNSDSEKSKKTSDDKKVELKKEIKPENQKKKPSKSKPVKQPPKREYCIGRDVPAEQSIGLSDLEFLVDEVLSDSDFWTKDNTDIVKIYSDFNLAKEIASQYSKHDKSVRVVPKKIAIRKIEEQVEAARIEHSVKAPIGVGEGLAKLNLL